MSYAIVDFRISSEERNSLENLGFDVLKCPPSTLLYDAICGHPDILLYVIDNNNILVHKNIPKKFVDKLISLNLNVLFSEKELTNKYPDDIILNSFSIQNLFIHNIKYTDPILLNNMKNKKFINIKQGYAKCSTAIVSDNAVMTSDTGIAYALKNESIDVLLLPPGDILLPGLNYGFIGGCCGLLDEKHLAFYGNLKHYAYGDEVKSFLKKHNVDALFLSEGKLIDRGSLFILNKMDKQKYLETILL